MISLIVPTRNRAYTLRLVLPSYFEQEGLDEIILVCDACTDETEAVFAEIGAGYPEVHRVVVRNPERRGASACRNVGVEAARNALVMFCDDDEYLEVGYARACLALLTERRAGAVSGRRIYMQEGETPSESLLRFGFGRRPGKPFFHLLCELNNRAKFDTDVEVPFTNAIILTRRDLVQRYGFDEHYAQGNGYREESDYQMNLFVNGHSVWIASDVHSIHLPMSAVHTGGQRVRPFHRIYWMVRYTNYFFDKYYDRYAARLGLRVPRSGAKFVYAVFAIYKVFFHATVRAAQRRLGRGLVSRRLGRTAVAR